MQHEDVEVRSAFSRLQQLSREQEQAIAAENVELLLTIADLLPDAVARVRAAGLPAVEDVEILLRDMMAINDRAVTFLADKLTAIQCKFTQMHRGRKALANYRRDRLNSTLEQSA